MTNKELYYFACRCLSLDEHPEFRDEIIRSISDESNSRNFVQLCSNHLILPAIYWKFQEHKILQELPEELAEFLQEVHQLNLQRNDLILKQVEKILLIFNEHNIFPTFLKGAGNLLDGVYNCISERMMGDIDILVSEEDYLKAAQLLEKDGYTHENPSYFDVADMKHYPRLFKKGEPADVEIHRLPVRIEYTKMYNTELINQEKKPVNKSFSCYVLSDKHKVIHNFIHCQLSNNGHKIGVVPIRDIYDLYLFSKRTSISLAFQNIQHKSKAVAYFLYAGNAFNHPIFTHRKTNTYRLFTIKNELCFKYQTFYRINKDAVYLSERLYKYFKQIFESVYSSRMRKSLLIRMTNRQWHENHINTYRNFFSARK